MHHQYIPALIEAGINASTQVGNIYCITDKMWRWLDHAIHHRRLRTYFNSVAINPNCSVTGYLTQGDNAQYTPKRDVIVSAGLNAST